jgi:predicted aldo/keto reductase-like oxidoreductase
LKERILGKTGIKVRTLGFGGIPIQQLSEEDAIAVVRRCYELGINFYDTARGYTVSEERIGKALKEVRGKVVFATKTHAQTKDEARKELDTSLRNLKTDYIDIYQLHSVSSKERWDQVSSSNGALEALYQARDEGTILHLGITSHNPSFLTQIVKEAVFETIMIPFNYLATEPAEKLLPLCHRMKVGTIIMKPFGGGAFSNARTALKFVLSNRNVDVVIPGMMSIAEVEDNFSIASSLYSLSDEELQLVEQDREYLGMQFCRACNYCQPCPQEIPISSVLRAESQFLKRMGWTPWLKTLVQEAGEKIATCTECGECESRCPYHLRIIELLPEKIASLKKIAQQYA